MHKNRTYDIISIALTAAIIVICSWITVPVGDVQFTMQTFAVFVSAVLLGSVKGTLAVLIYILLGVLGLPVFSSFQSGFGVLFGATGGFIFGFVFITLIGGFFSSRFPHNMLLTFVGLIIGLIVCYSAGSLWFMYVYLDSTESISVSAVFASCVLPYIIPDILKMTLAVLVSKKVKTAVKGYL